jgi:hypothetical protein
MAQQPSSVSLTMPSGDDDPELAALLAELGGRAIDRPLDPQTGQPVRVPSDPGFVPFGDEPIDGTEAPRPGALSLIGSGVKGALSSINPMNIISGLSAVSTPQRAGETLRGLFDAQKEQGRQAVNLFRNADVRTGAGRLNAVEGIGRGLASVLPVVGPAAARLGDEMGSGDPERMATAGGEVVGMIAGPAAVRAGVRRAAPALQRGGEWLAERTMRAPDDVLAMTDVPDIATSGAARATARRQLARTALDEGVTPGIVSSGSARSRAALEGLVEEADTASAGNFTPINPAHVRGRGVMTMGDRYKDQINPADDVADIAKVIKEAESRIGHAPDVRNATRITSGNIGMVRGQAGAAADASRAVGRDVRREIGQVAPEMSSTMGRINRLEPVSEAYQRIRTDALEVPGVPTIQARIMLAGLNRLVGPSARGMDRLSRVRPETAGNAARMAALSALLDGAMTPVPSH